MFAGLFGFILEGLIDLGKQMSLFLVNSLSFPLRMSFCLYIGRRKSKMFFFF